MLFGPAAFQHAYVAELNEGARGVTTTIMYIFAEAKVDQGRAGS